MDPNTTPEPTYWTEVDCDESKHLGGCDGKVHWFSSTRDPEAIRAEARQRSEYGREVRIVRGIRTREDHVRGARGQALEVVSVWRGGREIPREPTPTPAELREQAFLGYRAVGNLVMEYYEHTFHDRLYQECASEDEARDVARELNLVRRNRAGDTDDEMDRG